MAVQITCLGSLCAVTGAASVWRGWRAGTTPSVAEMMEPFIRMCQDLANSSGRFSPASSAKAWTWPLILLRYPMLAWPSGCPDPISSRTLMNVHASKSVRWNQSPNTSKLASSRSSAVLPRLLASETMRSTATQRSFYSRPRTQNASPSSSQEGSAPSASASGRNSRAGSRHRAQSRSRTVGRPR